MSKPIDALAGKTTTDIIQICQHCFRKDRRSTHTILPKEYVCDYPDLPFELKGTEPCSNIDYFHCPIKKLHGHC